MTLIDRILEDFLTAQENHEQYQIMQNFYKGKHATSESLLNFMHLEYLPKPLRAVITKTSNCINWFFNWWMDFHKISFLTLLMLCGAVYIFLR